MIRIIQRFASSKSYLIKSLVQQNRVNACARYLSSDSTTNDETANKTDKKKKQIIPRITLISDGEVTITTLEEAQKLSHRRSLKLIKVVDLDLKTQRAVYKLLSGHEYYAEELKNREERKAKKDYIKGEKLLSVSSKIASGDLFSKTKLVSKWIQKNYEVRVIISRDGGENAKMEQIAKDIEKTVPEARILQKRVNNSDIRFSIVPPKPKTPEKDSNGTVETKDKNQQVRSYHTDSS